MKCWSNGVMKPKRREWVAITPALQYSITPESCLERINLLLRFLCRLLLTFRLFLSGRLFSLLFSSSGFLFLLLLGFARVGVDFVAQHDADVTRPFQNAAGAAPRARHDSPERRTLANNRFFDDETVGLGYGIVFRRCRGG